MSFGQAIYNDWTKMLTDYTVGVYDGIMGSWPAMTITGLYIMFVGYGVLMGYFKENTRDVAVSIFLLMVLQSLAADGGYNEWIAGPILGMTDGLTNLASGGGTRDVRFVRGPRSGHGQNHYSGG